MATSSIQRRFLVPKFGWSKTRPKPKPVVSSLASREERPTACEQERHLYTEGPRNRMAPFFQRSAAWGEGIWVFAFANVPERGMQWAQVTSQSFCPIFLPIRKSRRWPAGPTVEPIPAEIQASHALPKVIFSRLWNSPTLVGYNNVPQC
jgi:hypothetical protein